VTCGCGPLGGGTGPTCDRCGNPRAQTSNSPGAPQHAACAPSRTLVEELGSVVDDLRQLNTDFGLRPYRVFSVRVRWTGGEVGRGECRTESVTEFLPTPRLDEPGVQGAPRSAGLPERGQARLRELSPRYTEDQIRGLLCCSLSLPPGVEGWVEVMMDARDGLAQRRRFVVSGMPYRDAGRFEWRATLIRQDQDRARGGEPYPYDE